MWVESLQLAVKVLLTQNDFVFWQETNKKLGECYLGSFTDEELCNKLNWIPERPADCLGIVYKLPLCEGPELNTKKESRRI